MSDTQTPGEKLQQGCMGTKLSLTSWGISREMDASYKEEIAEQMDTDARFLSLKQRLIDTKNPWYKKVSKAKAALLRHWKHSTIAYIEKGVRLLQKQDLSEFLRKLEECARDLADAVQELDEHRHEIVTEAEQELGRLFKAEDYPGTFKGLWGHEITYPNLEPPSYLMQLNPEAYEEEKRRLAASFETTGKKYEALMAQVFQDMLTKLADAMKPAEDGSRKKIVSSTVQDNLVEALAQFRKFSTNDKSQLNEVATQIEQLVTGYTPGDLKHSDELRTLTMQRAEEISKLLTDKIGVEPRRKIWKKKPVITPAPDETPGVSQPEPELQESVA